MELATRFNTSGLGRWSNSVSGRVFRLLAGVGFVVLGVVFWGEPVGAAALIWSVFPLSAGAFDLCWVSAAMGGPFRGADCRAQADQT